MIYDLIIVGGGTAGCACAYIAAKLGLKTLLIEKNIHLGGSITSGFVTPAMKTQTNDFNCDFFHDFVEKLKVYNAQITYSDGNEGWFNPELAKLALDDMLCDVGCEVLFCTCVNNVCAENNFLKKISCSLNSCSNQNFDKTLSLDFLSKYFVDATGDGNFAQICGCNFLNKKESQQALTQRFLISGVDLEKFKKFILEIDKDRTVTNSATINGEIHLTTAYTWDSDKWGLTGIFKGAISNGDLKEADSAYFQLFTVAGMPGTVTLNCPRIPIKGDFDIFSPSDVSKALILGRQQVYRIYKFCKKYLEGFEKSYISNIADMLGVRESRRVEGKYIYSEQDILQKSEFTTVAAYSDYPIDIHSNEKASSVLEMFSEAYSFPIEALKAKEIENLYIIGRCLSATFKAQAALRIQPTCFSMGEAVAQDVKMLIS